MSGARNERFPVQPDGPDRSASSSLSGLARSTFVAPTGGRGHMFLPWACQALLRLRLLRLACLLVTPGAGFGRGIAVAGLLFRRPLHRRRRVLHALLPIGAGGVGLFIAAVAA